MPSGNNINPGQASSFTGVRFFDLQKRLLPQAHNVGILAQALPPPLMPAHFFILTKKVTHRYKTGLFTYIKPSNGISGITVDWAPDYTMRNYQAVPNLDLPVMQGELLVKVVMRCTVNDKGNTASGGKTLFYFAIQETVSKLYCPRSTASLLTDPCMQSGLSRHPRNLFSLSRSVPQIQARDDVL